MDLIKNAQLRRPGGRNSIIYFKAMKLACDNCQITNSQDTQSTDMCLPNPQLIFSDLFKTNGISPT